MWHHHSSSKFYWSLRSTCVNPFSFKYFHAYVIIRIKFLLDPQKITALIIVLVCYSSAAIKHWPNATWRRKGLFGSHAMIRGGCGRESGQELKQGQRPESMRKATYWLVLPGFLSVLPCTAQEWYCWDGSSYISHWLRDASTDVPTGQSNAGNSSVDALFFWVTLARIKLTKANQYYCLVTLAHFTVECFHNFLLFFYVFNIL